MRKQAWIYLLLLAIPLVAISAAAHRLISAETARGREIGQAYLQSEANALALQLQSNNLPSVASATEDQPVEQASNLATRLPLLVGIVKADGSALGESLPNDGRCFGKASLSPKFPDLELRTMWPGCDNPGRERVRKLHRIEWCVYAGSLLLFLVAATVLVASLVRAKASAAEAQRRISDFSHRLKTPITSISLCAELMRSGRIDAARKQECAETIVAEADKLNGIVGEVLNHIERRPNG